MKLQSWIRAHKTTRFHVVWEPPFGTCCSEATVLVVGKLASCDCPVHGHIEREGTEA